MNNFRLVRFTLNILVILLSVLFILFFVYVYQDYSKTETVTEFIDISANQEEIEHITIADNKEGPKTLEMESSVTQVENNNYEGKLTNDKFYYNQLDKYSQLIYKSLESQKENLKNGNNIISLPKEIVLEEEQNDIKTVFTAAINAFEYDNPDVFYLDVTKLVLFYQKDSLGNYNIFIECDNQYNNYLNDTFNGKQDVEQAQIQIDSVIEEIKMGMEGLQTNYDKILYVHDWIVENVKYDETLNRINRNNIYGAFVEREVTCGGYAKAFKYLMDKLNINCIIIQGTATSETKTENHAWNYIKMNENWYGIDCTWDDPVIIGGKSNKKYYTYFLKGKETFVNHKPLEIFFGTNLKLNYPELNKEKYK